ncbi:MAG: lytic transglycosylase [Proteobacteria bacterium]|nr:MAG: lytic transglycosylase [Pseudomonadota bacterium]
MKSSGSVCRILVLSLLAVFCTACGAVDGKYTEPPPVRPDVKTVRQTGKMLNGPDFMSAIRLNDPIKAALDDWLTWGRPQLLEAYEYYQYLKPLIAPIYQKSGFPESLLFAMIATESAGKAHAYSRAGAAGLLQFMRFTGKKYGLRVVDGFDQRLDPVLATHANARYLTDHLKLFHNNIEKTLAAYNGGENRVLGLQQRNKGKAIWDRHIFYALPRETREYVPKVLAAAWLFTHPEDFRLEFPEVDNRLASLKLQRDSSLSELTLCLGQQSVGHKGWFRTLRNLNPKIKPGDVLEKGVTLVVPEVVKKAYHANCATTDEAFLAMASEMHKLNYPDGSNMFYYVVKRGDTANRIADRFQCVSTRELAAINNIRPPRYTIRVGQVLQVPGC